jgi:NAD-dependent SIR2 family protein deacetylase
MGPIEEESLRRAARAVEEADVLLICAGAGMGVDSGLPDFRGPEGFWKAYPPYAKLGLAFESVADPEHFTRDPAFGWGFYGHRTNLYRATRPHEGFATLLRWAGSKPLGSFVFTSNVDDHFRKAGFDPDRVVECHGSVEWWQCLARCGSGIFPADDAEIPVDPTTFRAVEPLPSCPKCGGLARPNILMFGDWDFDSRRTDEQNRRLMRWLRSLDGAKPAILEFGAGRAIPTVRRFSEQLVGLRGARLIRVNPRESQVPEGQIALPAGALDAIRAIDARIEESRGEGFDQG